MQRMHAGAAARAVRWSGPFLLAVAAAGCRTPAPEAPADVRVAEIAPAAADAIAERVAARLAERPAAPPAPAPAPRPPAAPTVRPAPAVLPPPPAAPAATPPSPAALAALGERVDRALDWLAAHQSKDGSFSASDFGAQCPAGQVCDGPGEAFATPGVTGLALLCFLGRGQPAEGHAHAEATERALGYLRSIQDSEGCFGPRTNAHFMYAHGYAALAMTEAYGLTRSPRLRESAQRAVNFVHYAQNPYLGWRYGVRDGDNDTSLTALMMHVIQSAERAGLEVDPGAMRGGVAWLDKMTDPVFGRTGYQQRGGPPARTAEAMARFPADRVESLTAAAVSARLAAGQAPHEEFVRKGAALLAQRPPVWDPAAGTIDFVYWYWGTLALSRAGDPAWTPWVAAVVPAVADHQEGASAGHEHGSWDPIDPWSATGGRVYSTAMACLTCEILLRTAR